MVCDPGAPETPDRSQLDTQEVELIPLTSEPTSTVRHSRPARRTALGLLLLCGLALCMWVLLRGHNIRSMTMKGVDEVLKGAKREKIERVGEDRLPLSHYGLVLTGRDLIDLFGGPHEEARGPSMAAFGPPRYYWRYRCSDGWLIVIFEGPDTVDEAARAYAMSITTTRE